MRMKTRTYNGGMLSEGLRGEIDCRQHKIDHNGEKGKYFRPDDQDDLNIFLKNKIVNKYTSKLLLQT